MAERVDCVVVGAGVIGLAIARRLAWAGREVIIVEAANTFGSEISARNSEVVHAGIYYPTGSLKARLCRTGRDRLYDYLANHGIAHDRCGKLIVATSEAEVPALRAIESQARRNGVEDIHRLEATAAAAMEPELACIAALHSPSTGIFDSHGFMLSLLGQAEAHGAVLALASPVVGGALGEAGIRLRIGGAAAMDIVASIVVNAAGLGAQAVAGALAGFPPRHIPPLHYAKGNYFALAQRPPFNALIYPLPDQAGLGVHYTRDLSGAGRFGPDVEWVDHLDYTVAAVRSDGFYGAIRRYWPGLRDGALSPDYAGIRPKIVPPGAPAADFLIQGEEVHAVPGLVHLFGIESPGLTASLAIADDVAARLALTQSRSAPDR